MAIYRLLAKSPLGPEEIEILVVEGLGQIGRQPVQGVPAQVGLPCIDRFFRNQVIQAFEEIRCRHVECFERPYLNVLETGAEIVVRR